MRFFCSRAGPRAAPCLIKIPLYSRPSRFQSAFIISFLKNLLGTERGQQPAPRLFTAPFLHAFLFYLFIFFLISYSSSLARSPSFFIRGRASWFSWSMDLFLLFSPQRCSTTETKKKKSRRTRSFIRRFLSIERILSLDPFYSACTLLRSY